MYNLYCSVCYCCSSALPKWIGKFAVLFSLRRNQDMNETILISVDDDKGKYCIMLGNLIEISFDRRSISARSYFNSQVQLITSVSICHPMKNVYSK